MHPARLTLSALVVTALLFLGSVPAHAAKGLPGSPGPFTGFVVQGQTNVHLFATPPPEKHCILPVTWVVTLTYVPTGDTLALSAGGETDVGSGGFAQVSFEAACSTSFLITVTGVQVALIADYVVKVTG